MRVTRGTSGIGTIARLLMVAPVVVCKVTPLVDGRLRNGRTGLLDNDDDRSLSSLKLDGYRSRVAAHMDRFKCQLIEPNECTLISRPSQPSSYSQSPSVGTCVKVLVDKRRSRIQRAK